MLWFSCCRRWTSWKRFTTNLWLLIVVSIFSLYICSSAAHPPAPSPLPFIDKISLKYSGGTFVCKLSLDSVSHFEKREAADICVGSELLESWVWAILAFSVTIAAIITWLNLQILGPKCQVRRIGFEEFLFRAHRFLFTALQLFYLALHEIINSSISFVLFKNSAPPAVCTQSSAGFF